MRTIDRLKRDHTILRTKLGMLEAGLQMGPETWFVLREVCHTLALQLRDHIRREETLVAAYRAVLKKEALEHLTVEHRDEPERLRTLSRLFVRESGQSLQQVAPVLKDVIQGLRHHMDEEEAEMFPALERMLASREAELVPAELEEPARIQETMTVNRIVQEFPRTRPVFEQLFVNIPYEGSDCLDEVAWRHGLESRELLAKLEEALEFGVTSDKDVGFPGVSCSCQ